MPLQRMFCCFRIGSSSSPKASEDLLIDETSSSSRAAQVLQVYEIPQDLFLEILLRVPAEFVTKFRGLSKFHRDSIDGPDFRRNHTHLSTKKTGSHVILSNIAYASARIDHQVATLGSTEFGAKVHNLMNSWKQKGYSIVGCCLGILSLLYHPSSRENRHILLWNPLTGDRRSINLASYNMSKHKCFLGHDAATDDLKILKVHDKEFLRNYDCEIYSYRTDSWKNIVSDDNEYRPALPLGYRGCFVRGTNSLHIAGDHSDNTICAFDFSFERFKKIPLPKNFSINHWYTHCEMSDLDGCLCVGSYCFSGASVGWSVWIMKEYGVQESWTKLYWMGISSSDLYPGDLYPMPLQYVNDGRQLLLFSTKCRQNGVCLFDFEGKKLIKNLLSDQNSPNHFLYTSSLRGV